MYSKDILPEKCTPRGYIKTTRSELFPEGRPENGWYNTFALPKLGLILEADSLKNDEDSKQETVDLVTRLTGDIFTKRLSKTADFIRIETPKTIGEEDDKLIEMSIDGTLETLLQLLPLREKFLDINVWKRLIGSVLRGKSPYHHVCWSDSNKILARLIQNGKYP
jgi:hypothetical protein